MAKPYLEDPDLTLYVGDVMEVLPTLPVGSVDCVVTSPPYWGLRDYGTGSWEGGDPDCDHAKPSRQGKHNLDRQSGEGSPALFDAPKDFYADVCGKCGATRVDSQLGLEATPDAYVARMVEVFREVRRVLAAHGTCWVNLGDSYAATVTSDRHFTQPTGPDGTPATKHPPQFGGQRTAVGGLKPKDLCMIPARVALALQADGWYLRADIIWSKPNPMPESVTDRPTKSHEFVFLLTKKPRYFFDQEAVREANQLSDTGWVKTRSRDGELHGDGQHAQDGNGTARVGRIDSGRNVRSVWEIATQPYPEAHFATYPEELVRRCLLAGCPEWVCGVCGKPRERIVEATGGTIGKGWHGHDDDLGRGQRGGDNGNEAARLYSSYRRELVGWSDCGHDAYRPGVVLDPFMGSGTTSLVARKHGRRSVGVELNPEYARLAAKRCAQLSLLA